MRWWSYVLIGLTAYLYFLAAAVPARYVFDILNHNDIPIGADQVTGSVWHGQANQIVYDGVDMGAIQWGFRPLALLMGKIQYQVRLKSSKQTLNCLINKWIFASRYALSDCRGNLDAANVFKLFKQPNLVVGGRFELNLDVLVMTSSRFTAARGKLQWLDASLKQPLWVDLGNLQFSLTGDETELKSIVKEIDGPLQIDGEISLFPTGGYRIQGKVKTTTPENTGLAHLLQSLGRPTPDGSTRIDYAGQF